MTPINPPYHNPAFDIEDIVERHNMFIEQEIYGELDFLNAIIARQKQLITQMDQLLLEMDDLRSQKNGLLTQKNNLLLQQAKQLTKQAEQLIFMQEKKNRLRFMLKQ